MSERTPTNYRTHLFVGAAHAVLGVALAIFINHFVTNLEFFLPRKWYESYWMPLWVACLAYVIEGALLRLPASWVYGLLVTALPYGWHFTLASVLYLRTRGEVEFSEYAKVAVPALLLALSGAILAPIIIGLVARLNAKLRPAA